MSRYALVSLFASAILFVTVPSCGGGSSGSKSDGAAGQSGGTGGRGGTTAAGGNTGTGGGVADAGIDNTLPANECLQGETCDTQGSTCQTACTGTSNSYRFCTCRQAGGPGAEAGSLTWGQCQNRNCPTDGSTGFDIRFDVVGIDASGIDAAALDAAGACPSGSCTGNTMQFCTSNGAIVMCRCQQGTWNCN